MSTNKGFSSSSRTVKSKKQHRSQGYNNSNNNNNGKVSTTTTGASTIHSKHPNKPSRQHPSGDEHDRLATRVCIKNLPPNVTTDQLKAFLTTTTSTSKSSSNHSNNSMALVFTDCRILHHHSKKTLTSLNDTPKSTQPQSSTANAPIMAFCGFASPEMAQHVLDTFHKTYLGTRRILVEPAVKKESVETNGRDGKDATTTISMPSSTSSSSQRLNKRASVDASVKTSDHNSGPSGGGVHQSRWKPNIWANDDDYDMDLPTTTAARDVAMSSDDDDDDDEDNGDMNHIASDHSDDDDGDDNDDDDDDNEEEEDGNDEVSGDRLPERHQKRTFVATDAVSDLDFLKSKQKLVDDLEEVDEEMDNAVDVDDDEEHHGDSFNINNAKIDVQQQQQQQQPITTHDSDMVKNSDNDHDESPSDEKDLEDAYAVVDPQLPSNKRDSTSNSNIISPEVDDDTANMEEDPHRLFVRNLPFFASEKELRALFQPFGTVYECYVPFADGNDDNDDDDRQHSRISKDNKQAGTPSTTSTRHNKGFAFVSFAETASASAAKTKLDGSDFQGRLLHILPARKVPTSKQNENELNLDAKNLTYKQRQALLRRQQEAAASNSNSWSTSFVRGDAVVDSLAEQLGLRKADIVNAKQDGITAGEAAVRLALGETHVIEENRNYFRTFGIDMDALVLAKASNENASADTNKKSAASDDAVVRSKTSILVKNLPFSTTLDELTKVVHGAVSSDELPKQILLPPSRTIALVEYRNSADAKRAFRRLAYKRFQHVPLYLEWAPLAALGKMVTTDSFNETSTDKKVGPQHSSSSSVRINTSEADEAVEDDIIPGVSHTIYVKNLNFSTSEAVLQQVFSTQGTVRAVKIPQKIAPIQKKASTSETDVKTLSMGYGFVELASSDEVRRAIQQLQGTLVDGHALELKPSNKEIAPKHPKSKLFSSDPTKKRTKLIVRNVAFQASRKELLQLFGSFGQLRKVRLPKKFDGTHRGFAFCEYLTHKEAETAMQSLSQTHLYGRHLVLEWASETDEIDLADGVDSSNQPMTNLRDKANRDVALEPKKKRSRTGEGQQRIGPCFDVRFKLLTQ